MAKNYVLIDYENVNDAKLGVLVDRPFDVMVFVGANQTKIPIDLAMQMAKLTSADYVRISGNGPNALDFHIAFYLGRLAEQERDANFHVVSKDKGFDPLIRHLRSFGTSVHRVGSLSEVRLPRAAKAKSVANAAPGPIDAIVRKLIGQGASKPRRVRTLARTIQSLFRGDMDDDQARSLIEEMRKQGYVTVNKEAVSYHLK